MIITLTGGLVYWWASQRRSMIPVTAVEPVALSES
jgi:hypothetical protein